MVFHLKRIASLVAVVIVAGGCRPDLPRIEDQAAMPDTLPPVGEVAGAQQMGAVGVDPAQMRGHADQTDQMVQQMRQHIQTMRLLPPQSVRAHMGEHTQQVVALHELVHRQAQEFGAGEQPGEARAAQAMGLRPDQYRVLLEEVQVARAEAEELQRATDMEIIERLPGHLDRLERVAASLETSAAHMRRL